MADRPNYYDRPAVKPPPFDSKVAGYITLGGIAGAAQIIAAVANTFGGRRMNSVVRNGRYLALAGAVAGPLLLVAHLKTPRRWYNMLRIFRGTSPMSIGSWILTGFGVSTGVTAVGQLAKDRRGHKWLAKAGDAMEVPTAVLGAGMATYTASLLSATSNPLWAAAPRPLAARSGSAAMAGGAAALSLMERLCGEAGNCRRLDALALLATAMEAVSSLAARRRYRAEGVARPLEERHANLDDNLATLVGQVVPLTCLGINALRRQPSTMLSVVGALSILAGSAMSRTVMIEAGKSSAHRPDDYLHFTRGTDDPADMTASSEGQG